VPCSFITRLNPSGEFLFFVGGQQLGDADVAQV
jgi:hypothetical protein